MKKFNVKQKHGITLIALVITIIILLILAGISISALTHTGIFARANDAKTKTAMAQEDESVKMAVASATIEGEGELTTENLQEALTKSGLDGNLSGEGPWIYEGKYNKYDIEKTGDVKTSDKIVELINDYYGITESGSLVRFEFDDTQFKWTEESKRENLDYVGKIKATYDNGWSYYVINSKGEVYAWGSNSCGELGIGNTEDQDTPVKIEGLTNVEEIYTVDNSSYAKTAKGETYAWGNNEYGELGIGNTENQDTPVKIENLKDIEEIYVYEHSAYAKTTKGEVYVWGDNELGQLGIGNVEKQIIPIKIEEIKNAEKIYGVLYWICIKDKNGEVFEIGEQGWEKIGIDVEEIYATVAYDYFIKTTSGEIYEPSEDGWSKIEELKDIKKMYFDGTSIFAVTLSGEVYAWGDNEDGKLGIGNTEDQNTPVKIEGLINVKEILTYDEGIFAITTNGELYGWGNNKYGQLGIGNNEAQYAPVRINGVSEVENIYIVPSWRGNYREIYAKTKDGKLYVWGNNNYGQLGMGRYGESVISTPICLSDIKDIWENNEKVKMFKTIGLSNVDGIFMILTDNGGIYKYSWAAPM